MLYGGEMYLKKLESKINRLIVEEPQEHDEEIRFKLNDVDHKTLIAPTILDVQEINLKNVIWCTGFKANYDWLTVDIFKEDGSLNLIDGVATKENIYFCGMGLEPDPETKSSFGVGLYALVESASRAVNALKERM
jgi:putative flavoprotein involved in K+ transport